MKIAIIGNADIHGTHGVDIDTHDIVIRFNHCRIKGYEEHVGTKTTALGVALGTNAGANHLEHIDKDILRQINTIIFSRHKINTMYEDRIKQLSQKNIYFQYVNNITHEQLVKKIGNNPSTGISVIWHIIKHDMYNCIDQKINVYNFDSFKTVHYWEKLKREKPVLYHPIKQEYNLLCQLHNEGKINYVRG